MDICIILYKRTYKNKLIKVKQTPPPEQNHDQGTEKFDANMEERFEGRPSTRTINTSWFFELPWVSGLPLVATEIWYKAKCFAIGIENVEMKKKCVYWFVCLFVDVMRMCELGIVFIIKEGDCWAGVERILAVDFKDWMDDDGWIWCGSMTWRDVCAERWLYPLIWIVIGFLFMGIVF